jgi:hypothetical protein
MAHDTVFGDAVDSTQRAASTFVSGDPEPLKNRWAQAEDVSIFGGWGAYELGWEQVGPRLEWAAARFAAGSCDYEPRRQEAAVTWVTQSGSNVARSGLREATS